MGDLSIRYLERKKAEYLDKIMELRTKIKQVEEEYDELIKFRICVLKSQNTYSQATSALNETLETVEPYRDYNRCVSSFLSAIERFSRKAGMESLEKSYQGLIYMIDKRGRRLYKEVENLNDAILHYNDQIEDVDAEINAQKAMGVQGS